ncbi:glycosyltransferase family 2 protein [archaeon]|nr:glycosyltransferase family 2 protein [archaeon]
MKLSVVMPAFNEEQGIRSAVRQVLSQPVSELLVVDDGSTDNTLESVKKLAIRKKRVKVISYSQNRGKGFALRKGASAAAYGALVFMDSDMQFGASQILRLAKRLRNGEMVVGCRDVHSMPLSRRVANAFAKLVVFAATGKLVKDVLSGFRAISKHDFQALRVKEDKFEIESELTLKALKNGLTIRSVPVSVSYKAGNNKLGSVHALKITVYLLKSMVKCWCGIYA